MSCDDSVFCGEDRGFWCAKRYKGIYSLPAAFIGSKAYCEGQAGETGSVVAPRTAILAS